MLHGCNAALATLIVVAAVAAGCGGSDTESVDAAALEGTWRYDLPRDYLLDEGISQQQADMESGTHTAVLADGSFRDSWRTATGTTGSCSGTYVVDGAKVTFTWKQGCFGDWEMTPTLDEDRLTWGDVKALPPNDSDEDQKINEAFNSVEWTRVDAAP